MFVHVEVYCHVILSYILPDTVHQIYLWELLFNIAMPHYTQLKQLPTFDYLFDPSISMSTT